MIELSNVKQEMIIVENCENDSVQSGQFCFVSCGTDSGECLETTEEIGNKQCITTDLYGNVKEEVSTESTKMEQLKNEDKVFSDAEIRRLYSGDTLAHSGLLNYDSFKDLAERKLSAISDCDNLNKKASSKRKQQEFFESGTANYQCDVCLKTFSKLYHLESHKLYHIGVKLHLCDICNRAFSRPATLKTHKLIHNFEKSFKCDICGKMFSQRQQMINHKISHSSVKKFKCHVCNKSFCHSSTLSRHKLGHSSVEKFVCELCNKVFLKPSSLLMHNLTHKKEML